MNYDVVPDINHVSLIGRLESRFGFDHRVQDQCFFLSYLLVERLSGNVDRIPVCIKQELLDAMSDSIYDGKVHITGIIISNMVFGKLTVKVRITSPIVSVDDAVEDMNEVAISGRISNSPYVRITPFGREISDFMLCSKRAYNKAVFVPAIAWGNTARNVARCPKNASIFIRARFQSRPYEKDFGYGVVEKRIAYELSVYHMSEYHDNNVCYDTFADEGVVHED